MKPKYSLPCSQEPPLDPILSQMNPVYTLTPSSFQIHFSIVLKIFT
jgi:hypothetical protein